ncbi:U3 small nucleolar RNA-associated protein 4 homolog [Schistocerca gregaria]|uniref:U3 small nucleolar RNA-associated protein 4 homolog n=1 Tax=Schistocerca gregaria TaxID=7010 RepID=UPI00211EE7F6|nr:U3 small nucleolar RNA-associated protein 4 homolog [Schistocerca gregaria]
MEKNLCKVHNIRFYNLEPRAIHCIAYESSHRKLAVSRADSSLEIWDVSNAPHVERFIPGASDSSIEALSWCGTRLFSTGLQGVIVEYNLIKLSHKSVTPVTAGFSAWCLDINRTHSSLAVGTEDGYINIFSVTDDGLQYEKVLDKQEGRILCLSWDATGDFIVSGSSDTIRIWNVDTGHAIHRMTTGRAQTKKETIVWCLAVTDDFTVISGDSRGQVCFWDGNMGVLSESHESHMADIFCLCLSRDQTNIYCAGMDPIIANYVNVKIKGQGRKSRWVKSVQRRIHDHDVRALALDENGHLFSGGLDGYLAISSYPPKVLVKYPPLLQGRSVVVAHEACCILLRHHNFVEVWRLGEERDGIMSQPATRLLTLNSRGAEAVTAATISSDSQWLAYSTRSCLRLFSFHVKEEDVSLQKVKHLPDECEPAHHLLFSHDSTRLIIATFQGAIVVLQLSDQPCLVYCLRPIHEKLHTDTVFLLGLSPDDQYLFAADHESHIAVWFLQSGKHYVTLPHYRCPATAAAISKTNNFVVVYSDHKITEYDLRRKAFTKFSRDLDGRHPKQWLSRNFPVTNVVFDSRNPDMIMLQDDSTFCIVDKKKELPANEAKIPRIDSPASDSQDSNISRQSPAASIVHAFHIVKKYKHLVHLEWLADGVLTVVEVSPSTLISQLPPALAKKRFGV